MSDFAFLANNPNQVQMVETLPPLGLSDHDVLLEIDVTVRKLKKDPRTIYLHKKADGDKIRQRLTDLQDELSDLANGPDPQTETLWTTFRDRVLTIMQDCIPTKTIKPSDRLPWMTTKIKRMISRCNKLHR